MAFSVGHGYLGGDKWFEDRVAEIAFFLSGLFPALALRPTFWRGVIIGTVISICEVAISVHLVLGDPELRVFISLWKGRFPGAIAHYLIPAVIGAIIGGYLVRKWSARRGADTE
jgi:hypothetical protein